MTESTDVVDGLFVNTGIEGMSAPDPTPKRTYGSGIPSIRLGQAGDIARFYFLDDNVITTLFHEVPVSLPGRKTFWSSRVCLRRPSREGETDLDPVERCPYCSDEDQKTQYRIQRTVGLVFHEFTAHRQRVNKEDRASARGGVAFFLEDFNQISLYLTKSKRTFQTLKEFAAEAGSLATVYTLPDFGQEDVQRTVREGMSQPFEVTRTQDGQYVAYDIEARPAVPTPAALAEARENIPDIVEIVKKEYIREDRPSSDDPAQQLTQEQLQEVIDSGNKVPEAAITSLSAVEF